MVEKSSDPLGLALGLVDLITRWQIQVGVGAQPICCAYWPLGFASPAIPQGRKK